MLSFVLRLLPTIVFGLPIAYFVLRHYFKGSVFFKIGMLWVSNLFFVLINTSFTSNFPHLFPLWFSTLIGIGFSAFLLAYSGKLLKPMRRATEQLNDISVGKLNVIIDNRHNNRNDEIGLLNRAALALKENLTRVISEIQQGAVFLSGESESISKASRELLESATFQASSIEEISSSMEEMVANIQQNADNSQKTEAISVKASSNMGQVVESSSNNLDAINSIAEKIRIINDIAFQTNILALNAAVESARAGEHGRGFAVVAAEVRKLAEKSKQAANDIIISTKSTVHITQQAAVLIKEVLPQISDTMSLVQEITAASEEQRIGTEQINSAILILNEKAQESTIKADMLNESAANLNARSEQLKKAVGFFTLD